MKTSFVLLLSCLTSAVVPATAEPGGTESALQPALPSITAGASSFSAAISPDARYVLFLSRANNLATNDAANLWTDVFLRDRARDITTLISVQASGLGGGTDDSSTPSVSSNGLWVAFESMASSLVPGDSNGVSDVFLRDVAAGATLKVSTAPGGAPANRASENPQISQDARYVVYESLAGNLVIGETNSSREIFVYDRMAGLHQRLRTGVIFPGQLLASNGPAHSACMTPDASQVAYVRSATNRTGQLVVGEVFSWDRQTAATHWISGGVRGNDQTGIPAFCANPALSGNGRIVAFKEFSGPLGASVCRRPNPPESNVPPELIAADATLQGWPTVSSDGRFVGYEAVDGVRLWDAQSASNRLVLGNLPPPGRRVCSQPALSADGRRLVFLVTSNDLSCIYLHDRVMGSTREVRVKSVSPPARIGDVTGPLFSEDGRIIVFDSSDETLVVDDLNRAGDVFAFELDAELLDCVSVRALGHAGVTPPVPSHRWPGSISADGRRVAVSTLDSAPSDTNGVHDVYVRDLADGRQYFLGHPTNSTTFPCFSADGRYVVYLSMDAAALPVWRGDIQNASVWRRDLQTGAEVLVHGSTRQPGDLSAFWERSYSMVAISPDGNQVAFVARPITQLSYGYGRVYVRDIRDETTMLVSGSYFADWLPADGDSFSPGFSPDGRWVLFGSRATDVTPEQLSGLFARDLAARRTYRISASLDGRYAISADSRHVASIAASGVVPGIGVFNLETRVATVVPDSATARSVSLSSNGRWLAYDAYLFGSWNVHVRDMIGQTNELISAQLGSTFPTRDSSHPAISHDGRYVAFMSTASNLVTGDANAVKDIFVRDRLRGVTLLASINRSGTGSGNGPSTLPVLAADGRTVLFQSLASDIIAGDYNEASDVFVLRLGGTDGDGDGMDDDWEAAYFGDLDRDGRGDLDGDGASDAAEHQLGTDPTNAGSVFQVLKLTREGGPGTKLLWSSIPGRTYRVQYNDDLASAHWTDAPSTVTAAGTTATWTDSAAGAHDRYYRVALVR